ncbi:HD domain-containing protein [Mangrovimicrobium sediminis]|uniref:HD domain-containing protein n=1 Tax=Mangrovimicrobium sediminis TaxID=2562682 RepID=A0A4Z0LVP1_9GAMM|nr:HD domain-containing phosphohydrolase [Haliea sp. SAOS-164]TGD71198.1 HD domain-containing protein [Haliea sp. SAOS-164]
MEQHLDQFSELNFEQGFEDKIRYLHRMIRQQHPSVSRLAIALHEPDTDVLTTFVYSAEQPSPLKHYQARLADCPSLLEIVRSNRPRVVNDMDLFAQGQNEHTQLMQASAYRASYTLPLFAEGCFLGFIFFNSEEKDAFQEYMLRELDMAGHLIAFMLYSARSKIEILLATVRSARSITCHRDAETGLHLERMAHYSKLIARQLADEYEFSDDYIEHIFLFSPLHDIGKLTVPDRILLKPGKLDEAEFEQMKQHAQKGREILDRLLENYGLNGIEYVELLRNIAMYHHEAVDGSGYPGNLVHEQIPIEARIVTVADVFDALTSARPYKPAWSNAEAFAKLREMSGSKLDPRCVQALLDNTHEVERIQQRFTENSFG